VRVIRPREKALSAALRSAFDQLEVFIPPPVQSIIAMLGVRARGTPSPLPLLLSPLSARALTTDRS
jgi:hypothetical protein